MSHGPWMTFGAEHMPGASSLSRLGQTQGSEPDNEQQEGLCGCCVGAEQKTPLESIGIPDVGVTMETVIPFWAWRYQQTTAGPLTQLIAPPYLISPERQSAVVFPKSLQRGGRRTGHLHAQRQHW